MAITKSRIWEIFSKAYAKTKEIIGRLVRTKSLRSCVPVAHAKSNTLMDQIHERKATFRALPDDVLYKYSTSAEWVTTLSGRPFTPYWIGIDWYVYAKDSDRLCFHLLAVWISIFSARVEHLPGGIWVSGQPFLSSSTTSIILTTVARHFLLPTKTIS